MNAFLSSLTDKLTAMEQEIQTLPQELDSIVTHLDQGSWRSLLLRLNEDFNKLFDAHWNSGELRPTFMIEPTYPYIREITSEDLQRWRDAYKSKVLVVIGQGRVEVMAVSEVANKSETAVSRITPVAQLKRGFTSGANEFFYVKDITADLSLAELQQLGLTKTKAKRVRVVLTEDGDTYLVEDKYLRPMVKSTRDVKSLTVAPSWVKYRVLMVSDDKRKLSGKHVLKYILDGEFKVFGTGPRSGVPARKPTCVNRKPWYALDGTNTGRFLWFMNITDTHAVPYNPQNFVADARFYNINPKLRVQETVLWGLLNATFTFLCAELYGRQFAGRGIDSIDIKVYEVAQLPMLRPRAILANCRVAIVNAVQSIAERAILPILEEVNQADRRSLDDAFLEAVGFTDPEERKQILESLYTAVCQRVQTRFDRARSVKHEVSQRGRANAQRIAAELIREIDPALMKKFPSDFLPASFAYHEMELPSETIEFERLTFNRMRVGDDIVDFETPDEAEFVQFCLENGVQGTIQVPTEPDILQQVVADYRSYVHRLEQVIDGLASSRTADRRLKARIKDALHQQLDHFRVTPIQQAKLI